MRVKASSVRIWWMNSGNPPAAGFFKVSRRASDDRKRQEGWKVAAEIWGWKSWRRVGSQNRTLFNDK
jgi:hypothetical protein